MLPSLSLSTSSRRRVSTPAAASSGSRSCAMSNNHQLTAGDIISVRFRRRSRATRSYSAKGMSSSSCASPNPLVLLFVAVASFFFAHKVAPVHSLSAARTEWISSSLQYYNRITRGSEHVQQSPTYLKSAMENYFALEKVRESKPHHAESIYRRLMEEFDPRNSPVGLRMEECEYASLAVPTLLLGLLLQREDRFDDARTVFEGFSHVLDEKGGNLKCSCAARVLQAHALFEMKQENRVKAAELIIRAVRLDGNLRPVLRWKQFRDAMVEYKASLQQQPQTMMFATP